MKLLISWLILAHLLILELIESIIVGNESVQEPDKSFDTKQNLTLPSASRELDWNSSFYYEPDAYLLNKHNASNKNNLTEQKSNDKQNDPNINSSKPRASLASARGRSGRMLDLDALVGDLAASRANKERSQSGDRQSRSMGSSALANLDVGPGKRLHIQGYIPILGVKDVGPDEQAEASNGEEQLFPAASALSAKNRRKMAHQLAPDQNSLPYEQSSIGHATFNVQRYLNTDPQPDSAGYNHIQQVQQASDAKQSGIHQTAASVVDTLKRPIKKLTSSFIASSSSDKEPMQMLQSQQQQQQQPQANCLCVPFYMCKSGYISESSLGRSQIQQMLQQQQQQQLLASQQPRQIGLAASQPQVIEQPTQAQVHRGTVESTPNGVLPSGQSYANSFVPVDERSFEREIITAPSPATAPTLELAGVNSSQTWPVEQQAGHVDQDTIKEAEFATSVDDFKQQKSNAAESQPAASPSSGANQTTGQTDELALNSDYSQEILGRMLGLKSSNSRVSTAQAGQQQSASGVCGLLRTCCYVAPQSSMSVPVQSQSQAQQQQFQRFQPLAPIQTMTGANNAYFLQPQTTAVQRIYSPMVAQNQIFNEQMSSAPSSLVHRISNQYTPPGLMQRPPAQVAQYARANPSNQPLQSFQQPLVAPPMRAPMASVAQQLGTRKLLDGRCGLRQSAGINGRVQNLQYHENAADFGEYPAQAAILKRLNGSESLFVCSGTLISHSWVATAAHCIRKHLNQGELKVRLGEWDVHRDDEFYPFVEKEIRELLIHPEFAAGNLINDIALLRLDSPIDATLPHVNPACLPTADESFARQRCWVTGWGKDSFGQRGSFQAVLQEVELPVLERSVCEAALRQTRLGPHYRLHAGFLCAGGEGGRDACEGDGGSGLYCSKDGGPLKVAGLVSWGIGCGQAGVPGVYVSLAHYRPWIESIISTDEDLYSVAAPYGMPSNSPINERSNESPTASVEGTNTTASTDASQPLS